jgi:hypothetical protein
MEKTYTLYVSKGRETATFHGMTAAAVERKRAKLFKQGYTCTIVEDEPPPMRPAK